MVPSAAQTDKWLSVLQPVGGLPITGAEGCCLCASGLYNAEKDLVAWLCSTIGLNFPEANRMKKREVGP